MRRAQLALFEIAHPCAMHSRIGRYSPYQGLPHSPRLQHGPATFRRAAKAGIIPFNLLRSPLARIEGVVIKQFLTRVNRAQGMDENTTVFFPRRAIGRAGMIDPTRDVATLAGIDHVAVIEQIKKGMIRIFWIRRAQLFRFLRGNQFAGVLDDACVFTDPLLCVNARTMHAGTTHVKFVDDLHLR